MTKPLAAFSFGVCLRNVSHPAMNLTPRPLILQLMSGRCYHRTTSKAAQTRQVHASVHKPACVLKALRRPNKSQAIKQREAFFKSPGDTSSVSKAIGSCWAVFTWRRVDRFLFLHQFSSIWAAFPFLCVTYLACFFFFLFSLQFFYCLLIAPVQGEKVVIIHPEGHDYLAESHSNLRRVNNVSQK